MILDIFLAVVFCVCVCVKCELKCDFLPYCLEMDSSFFLESKVGIYLVHYMITAKANQSSKQFQN